MTLTSAQLLGIPATPETAANRATRLGVYSHTPSDEAYLANTAPGLTYPTSMVVTVEEDLLEATFTVVGGTGARTIDFGDGSAVGNVSGTGPASGTVVRTYEEAGTYATIARDAGLGGLRQRFDLIVTVAAE